MFARGVLDLLVQAESNDDIQALESNRDRRLRYYPPFVLGQSIPFEPETSGPIDEVGASFSLSLRGGQGKRDGYIAITAVDVRSNEGPLSAPAQFTLIRPKPNSPPRPYPCGLAQDAPAGHASPPDRSGFATTCLTWDMDDFNTTEVLRYEVARALDSSILAVHLREWQKGTAGVEPIGPVVAGERIQGTLLNVSFNDETGLIEATIDPINKNVAAKFSATAD